MNSSACRQRRTPEPQVGVCVWSVSRRNDLMFFPHCRIVQPWYTPVFWSLKSVVVTCQAILNSSVDDPECTSARNIVGHNFGTDSAPVMLNFSYVEKYIRSRVPVLHMRLLWSACGHTSHPWESSAEVFPVAVKEEQDQLLRKGEHYLVTAFLFFSILKCLKFFCLYKHVFFMKVILKPDSLKCLLLRKLF